MRADQNEPVRLSDYRPSDYLVDTVELDIRLHPTATTVRARLSLRPNPAGRAGAPLHLDGDALLPRAVRLDGTALDLPPSALTPDRLTIEHPPAGAFALEVDTELDPTANTRLMGLYRTGSAYCTQCEAEGFRRITYMLDRPDVLAVYTTRVEAERAEASVLLANGNPVESGPVDGTDRHFAVWHDPHPKPSYLFAMVAGNLDALTDRFTTGEGRDVALAIYVEPGKQRFAHYAMDALKRSMRWDETAFGRAYDLDVFNIVAVSDFNMGAMENKGLNVFNDKYILASPETATDADYAGIETVVAHEYFHNWTGNRITCRDWFQLCLKEGLTVYRDQEFSADQRSRAVKRIADVRTLRARQFTEDGGPLAHNVRPVIYREINNFYTATIYEKGAEIIRMLRHLIGDAAFTAGMTLYFDRYDGTAATVEQFIVCFAETSGRDLTRFFRWYEQAGTPELTMTCTREPGTDGLAIELRQSTKPTPGQPTKQPQVIPIVIAMVPHRGGALPLSACAVEGLSAEEQASGLVVLETESRRFKVTNLPGDCTPSMLRGFSAPVRLQTNLDDADRLALLAHDTDGFNRWEAAQTVVTRLVKLRMGAGEKVAAQAEMTLRSALSTVLGGALEDPAFAAQVLAWPTEADLARDIGSEVDPDAVRTAREGLRHAVSEGLSGQMAGLYATVSEPHRFTPDAASAGRRALRTALLWFLAAGEAERGAALVAAQFDAADNMTDRMGALSVSCSLPLPNRDALLHRFFEQFGGEPLVVDKWFAVQAGIAEAGTLDRVRRLTGHPAFSFANPNRVYALVGGFTANASQFNRPDGQGYQFLADIVLQLDPKNPQVAARLLNGFRSWRLMEEKRAGHAEAALRRVNAATGLSADVRDIAERCLS